MTAGRDATEQAPSLRTILREWGRIGCIGFGGPPAHIALLRKLCVHEKRWLPADDFEDAIAACNLLPGPASTQLAIYCAWRLRGRVGALVGGTCFIAPGLALILALSVLFLGSSPPLWVKGAGAGAGAAVAAVAIQAGTALLPASWQRMREAGLGPAAPDHDHPRPWPGPVRWILYLAAGAVAAATLGPWLVVVLLGCGLVELGTRTTLPHARSKGLTSIVPPPLISVVHAAVAAGGLGSLVWVAIKVGALSYGGGFVIVPLMQSDAVHHYHWMTNAGFLNAVALGQITPGPVVQTVAAVGYAAAGIGGGLLAAVVAFTPSFAFIILGGHRFDKLRQNPRARAFLVGAGPAAIGAILGAAIPLSLALAEAWQFAVLAGAAVLLLLLRRGVVPTLVCAGTIGVMIAVAGGPMPH